MHVQNQTTGYAWHVSKLPSALHSCDTRRGCSLAQHQAHIETSNHTAFMHLPATCAPSASACSACASTASWVSFSAAFSSAAAPSTLASCSVSASTYQKHTSECVFCALYKSAACVLKRRQAHADTHARPCPFTCKYSFCPRPHSLHLRHTSGTLPCTPDPHLHVGPPQPTTPTTLPGPLACC